MHLQYIRMWIISMHIVYVYVCNFVWILQQLDLWLCCWLACRRLWPKASTQRPKVNQLVSCCRLAHSLGDIAEVIHIRLGTLRWNPTGAAVRPSVRPLCLSHLQFVAVASVISAFNFLHQSHVAVAGGDGRALDCRIPCTGW